MFISTNLIDLCTRKQCIKNEGISVWAVYNAFAVNKYWQIIVEFAEKLMVKSY